MNHSLIEVLGVVIALSIFAAMTAMSTRACSRCSKQGWKWTRGWNDRRNLCAGCDLKRSIE